MDYSIGDVLKLLGALGLFLYGMKLMSESLQKVAGAKMRSILAAMTSNRVKAILTGVVVTAVIQSSSATTVMVVSFVNAGLLSLLESIGVIMGANIGTTVTGWLIGVLGLKVSMTKIALPIIAFSLPLIFSKATRRKNIGALIIGFALLFIGLGELKKAVPDSKIDKSLSAICLKELSKDIDKEDAIQIFDSFKNEEVAKNKLKEVYPTESDSELNSRFKGIAKQFKKDDAAKIYKKVSTIKFISQYAGDGYGYILLYLLIGTLLTLIIQSSSATMAITLILCFNGLIPFELGAAMVLGENIGTTITANLAAMVANISAKRAARAHLIFNVMGVIWMVVLFYPFLKGISGFVQYLGGADPFENTKATAIALPIFHTVFNIINTFTFSFFARFIEKVVIRIAPLKEGDKESFRLKFINTGFVSTSELALIEAKKEIAVFAQHIKKLFGFVRELDETEKQKEFDKLYERIQKYEDISDNIEVEIANYLAKLSKGGDLSSPASLRVNVMLKIIGDIESVADSATNIARALQRKRDTKETFAEEHKINLTKMSDLVDKALDNMISNLESDYHTIDIDKAYELENSINELRDKLTHEHVESVKEKRYNYMIGSVYKNIFSECERIGDYIINVNEAIAETVRK